MSLNFTIQSLTFHFLLRSPLFTGNYQKFKLIKSSFDRFTNPILLQIPSFKISDSSFSHGLSNAIYYNSAISGKQKRITGSSVEVIKKCFFDEILSNNEDGGAIYIKSTSSHSSFLEIRSSYFYKCGCTKVNGVGGVAYLYFDFILTKGNCYDSCFSRESGGCFYIVNEKKDFTIFSNYSTFCQPFVEGPYTQCSSVYQIACTSTSSSTTSYIIGKENNISSNFVPTISSNSLINVAVNEKMSSFLWSYANFYNNTGGNLFLGGCPDLYKEDSFRFSYLNVAVNTFKPSVFLIGGKSCQIAHMLFYHNTFITLVEKDTVTKVTLKECSFDIPKPDIDVTFKNNVFDLETMKTEHFAFLNTGNCFAKGSKTFSGLYIFLLIFVIFLAISIACGILYCIHVHKEAKAKKAELKSTT